jgi:hypothetical protein
MIEGTQSFAARPRIAFPARIEATLSRAPTFIEEVL